MASIVGQNLAPKLIEKAFVLNFQGEEIRIQQIGTDSVTVPQNHVGEDKLANFCFPESIEEIRRTLDVYQAQFYTFALTNLDNKQLFGFCYRFLIYGEHLPRCICLMSYLPWFSFFQTVLLHLARMVTQHDNLTNIQRVVAKMMNFQLNKKERLSFDIEENNKTIGFVRTPVHEEAPWGFPSLKPLLSSLSTININKLFSALLHERRIIMWSQNLQKLSECMFASLSLLYPFLWTHIFIPLLPFTLLRYCCAPMPFFIGLHGSYIDEVKDMALEEVFFVDLDNNNCTTNYYDAEYDEEFLLYEENILPENHLHLINNAIEDYRKMIKKTQSADEEVVRSGFRQFFLLLVGSYKKYMNMVKGHYEFDKDLFLSKQPKQASYFMNSFCNLQMFERFMAEREAHFNKHKGELFYPSASNPHQQLPKNFKDVPSKFNNELIFVAFENQADALSRKTDFDQSLTNLKTNIDAQWNIFNQGFKKNFGLFINKMDELKKKIAPIADSIVLGDEFTKPKPTPQRAFGHRRNKSEIPVGSPTGSDDEDDDENKPVMKRAYSAKDLTSLENEDGAEDTNNRQSQASYMNNNTTGAVVNPPQYRRPSLSANSTPKKGRFQVNINPATENAEVSPEDKNNSVVIQAPKPKLRASSLAKSPTKVTFGSDDFSSYPAEAFKDHTSPQKDVPLSASAFFEDISFTEFQSNAPIKNHENQSIAAENTSANEGHSTTVILPNGLQASPNNPFIS